MTGAQLQLDVFPLDWVASCPDAQLLPGGERMLTVKKGRLVVWELGSERIVADVSAAAGTQILAVDPQGRRAVLTAKELGPAIFRLDRDNSCETRLGAALDNEPATAAAWSPKGDQVALATLSQRIVVVAT